MSDIIRIMAHLCVHSICIVLSVADTSIKRFLVMDVKVIESKT